MPVNTSLLGEHAWFEQPEEGFGERFVRLQVGSAETLGVVSRPLGPARDIGWVSCHSFGMEHVDMMSIERTTARGLAKAGYPVLRFHCQGYGDSLADPGTASLSTHVRDTIDAFEWATAHLGVSQVGLLGWKFGALVAARAAGNLGVSHLVLAAPSTTGARHMSDLLWSYAFKGWSRGAPNGGVGGTSAAEFRVRLEAEGAVDLGGLLLTAEAFHDNSMASLSDLESTKTPCLILQVSMSPQPQPSLRALADRLNGDGGRAKLVVLTHQFAPLLGRQRIRVNEFAELGDVLGDLDPRMASETLKWLDELEESSSTDTPRGSR